MDRLRAPFLKASSLNVDLGGCRILHDISLSIHPGEWVGLLGGNGSGKTTLLRTLVGRLSPTTGSIHLKDSLIPAKPRNLAEHIGFAPHPDTLPMELRGGELLDLVARARGAKDSFGPAKRVGEALETDRLDKIIIGQMSSGMRQRIALHIAFLGNPNIVLLDEPFNWLDPVAAYDLKETLTGLTKDGLGLVTALHDVGTFSLRCTSGLLINEGRIVLIIDMEDILRSRSNLGDFERDIYKQLSRRS